MVLTQRKWVISALVLTVSLLMGCGPQPTSVPGNGNGTVVAPLPSSTPAPSSTALPAAASSAQAWLATQLGVPVSQIVVKGVKPMEWPDSCLGLPKADEMCAMHVVSGWQASLLANNQTYEVRTDMSGSNVRANLGPGVLAWTKWTLVSFGLPGAETLVVAGSNVNLMFDAAGQASGSTGCNSYGSKVDIKGEMLTFSAIISTKRACVDANLNQQETRYLNALQHAGAFSLSGDHLTIFTDGGQSALNFVKQ